MIRYLPLLLFTVLLSACAAQHSVTKEGDTLLFTLKMSKAARVELASSADNFILHPMAVDKDGYWHMQIPARGEIRYFYLIDQTPYLPDCAEKENDDFGSQNCIYQP